MRKVKVFPDGGLWISTNELLVSWEFQKARSAPHRITQSTALGKVKLFAALHKLLVFVQEISDSLFREF